MQTEKAGRVRGVCVTGRRGFPSLHKGTEHRQGVVLQDSMPCLASHPCTALVPAVTSPPPRRT